ncbi:MAG: carbamoyltransferase HypF [Chlorobiaceae bacterium]|nr:carbamoyltransferase HypF [Chlorobiaceae bacterium]
MAVIQTGSSLTGPEGRERRRIVVGGIVQGVGFRPFVWRLACRYGLDGFIRNTASGVLIEVEGMHESLDAFGESVLSERPPLARITRYESEPIEPVGQGPGFLISGSLDGDAMETLIPPDIAICEDCLHDLSEPAGRRYHYAFTNCTNCGPRYTIVERIPYDRPLTTMKGFALCPECRREYDDPGDRRFHAQPNACPVCGPRLTLCDAAGRDVDAEDAVVSACSLLATGNILALKGIGGFHLAVDATNEDAVRLLRQRKGREEKPFAVMVRDIGVARSLCLINEDEAVALASPEAPIVLLRKQEASALAPSISPGNDRLGVMLPYSPLHWLLLHEGPEVLVMTSANLSEEPLACDNAEALERLGGIADHFLMHDRPIALRCDDSVAVYLAGRIRMVRRSRGYVPAPIFLREGGDPVLGTGGELKNTLCLMKGAEAIMSQHIGDMKNYEAYRHFDAVAGHLQGIFRTEAQLVVHDLHPSYLTTQWALTQKVPLLGVQHHHAHLASCLAENRYDGPAIGIMLDGSGYGTDGTVWGGEVLVGDAAAAFRFASLEPMPLPGGDAAVRHVWRTALGYLHRGRVSADGFFFSAQPQAAMVVELLDKGTGCAETSSCGRLFDAVASICGLRHEVSYEGQAAIELMQAAGGRVADEGYSYGFEHRRGRWQMLVSPMVREIAASVRLGADAGNISRRFHRTLVGMFSEVVRMAYLETGLKTVALSGGVFQNPLLLETLAHVLEMDGYHVLLHEQVPSNDGGLSLGQAAIGREYLKGMYRGVDS